MKNMDCRKLSSEGQEKLRKQVTEAIIERKMKQREAVALFQVSRAAIIKWLSEYRKKGINGLGQKNRGRPKATGKLNVPQTVELLKTIFENTPNQLKLPFKLWSKEAIKAFILEKFNVEISILTVTRILSRYNILPEKPIRMPLESNSYIIENWMKSEFKEINKKAKKEKAEIHWVVINKISPEQVALDLKSIKGKAVNTVISSIKNSGQLQFMVFKHSISSQKFLTFLTKLSLTSSKKIFLIVKPNKVYDSKIIDNWLEKNEEKIEFIELPDIELN
jgi:transposase